MHGHRNLEVWQRAHALAIRVHRLTGAEILHADPDLVRQVRRSTESIPDNIAEGRAGRTDGVYLRHLKIALGSAGEADSQFVRLRERLTWSPELAFEMLEELATIHRLLLALELSVKRRSKQHGGRRRPGVRRSDPQ